MIKAAAIAWTTNHRYRWSNYRHRKSPRWTDIQNNLTANDSVELNLLSRRLLLNFDYRPDGITHLFDSIDTPAGAWQKAFDPGPLRDDCDGFHAALYWGARGMKGVRLFTIVTSCIPDAHTLLLTEGDQIRIQDYQNEAGPFKTIRQAAEHVIWKRKMRGEFWVAELSVFENGWRTHQTIKAEG